jgi:8-oxo-dGTP pyrophosphatase MutT (NUDIX family)
VSLRPEDALFGYAPPSEPLFEGFDPERAPSGRPWRAAAVLFLVYARERVPTTVFIQRPPGLGEHSGQISLPGGRFEASDESLWHTALRETHEELGIPPAAVECLAALEPEYVGVSGYRVAPFIGRLAAAPTLRPDPREVAGVVEVPVRALLDPAIYREELRGVLRQHSPVYRYGAHEIWGATARMLKRILARPELHAALAAPPAEGTH